MPVDIQYSDACVCSVVYDIPYHTLYYVMKAMGQIGDRLIVTHRPHYTIPCHVIPCHTMPYHTIPQTIPYLLFWTALQACTDSFACYTPKETEEGMSYYELYDEIDNRI